MHRMGELELPSALSAFTFGRGLIAMSAWHNSR